MTVISLSTSVTNTVRQGQRTGHPSLHNQALLPCVLYKYSLKPFLGRQIWQKVLRMHFRASQRCCCEPECARCDSFGDCSLAKLRASSPHPSKEIDTPDCKVVMCDLLTLTWKRNCNKCTSTKFGDIFTDKSEVQIGHVKVTYSGCHNYSNTLSFSK